MAKFTSPGLLDTTFFAHCWFQLKLDTFEVGCMTLIQHLFDILKKKENSNTRKLRKIFRAPGENQTHDPPSSSSDPLTTDIYSYV